MVHLVPVQPTEAAAAANKLVWLQPRFEMLSSFIVVVLTIRRGGFCEENGQNFGQLTPVCWSLIYFSAQQPKKLLFYRPKHRKTVMEDLNQSLRDRGKETPYYIF